MKDSRSLGVVVLACTAMGAVGCSDPATAVVDAGSDVGHADAGGHDAANVDAGSDAAAADAFVPIDTGAGPDSGVPCASSADCDFGYYCHTVDGMCDGPGVCELLDLSQACRTADFVCGCDGADYLSPCAAARQGIGIDHMGTCDGSPGCTSDLDCPAGPGLSGPRFCQYPDGACGGTGVCTSELRAVLCTNHCVPQCGCDGISYRNDCDRRQHATSISELQECPSGPAICSRPGTCCTTFSDCELGQTCVTSTDDPTSARCEPIPPPPDCWRDEDCGDATLHCVGVFVCPCSMSCATPTIRGTCLSTTG